MIQRPPRSTRTDTLFPDTTLFRSILDTFTTTLGSYLNQLVTMGLRMAPFSGDSWVADWTIFYWAWWIAWAPFVGAFIARISRGRDIREFILGVVIAPSLLGFLWFSVRSEEHTSELQSLMRISYAVFCLKKKKTQST